MSFRFPAPVDMHVHFRLNKSTAGYVREHDRLFEYVLAMPNTDPPLCSPTMAANYRQLVSTNSPNGMKALVAVKLTPDIHPESIRAWRGEVDAYKLYPGGVTTNSEGGFGWESLAWCGRDNLRFRHQLEALQDTDSVLCVHGEMPDREGGSRVPPWEREAQFINYCLHPLTEKYSNLRVVLEHVSTAEGVRFVNCANSNMRATITLQHMIYSANDLMAHRFRPHRFCLPIPKTDDDRSMIYDAALSGRPKFFLGSDSAPHPRTNKECADCCGGCYTAPHLYESLFELFHRGGALENFGKFTSLNAREFYRLPAPGYEVEVREETWGVPGLVYGVVPLLAGTTLPWRAYRV